MEISAEPRKAASIAKKNFKRSKKTPKDTIYDTKEQVEGEISLFEAFPKLPAEIRITIWKEVCFLPRVIDVWVADAFAR
jgi:2EXR family